VPDLRGAGEGSGSGSMLQWLRDRYGSYRICWWEGVPRNAGDLTADQSQRW